MFYAKIGVIPLSLLSLDNALACQAPFKWIMEKLHLIYIYSLGGRCRLAFIFNCVNVFIEIFHRFMSSEHLSSHLKSLRGVCFRPVGTQHKHKFQHVDKIEHWEHRESKKNN